MSVWLTNIRFNTDRPVYREAYEYLMNMDRDKYKSFSNVIAHAVVDYFEREEKRSIDPYFTTKEREDVFIDKMVGAVESAVEKAMPAFMAMYISSLAGVQVPSKSETVSTVEADADFGAEIDFDFAV